MWSSDKIKLLIELVKTRECLWHVKSCEYRNHARRRLAYEEIAAILDIPTEEIKRKLHTLRAQYSKETGKIRKMEHSSGRTYSSKWEHYDQLRFMFSHSEEWSTPDQRVAEYNSQSIDAEDVKPAMELTTNVIEVESYPSTSYSNLQDSQTSLAASSPISSPAPPYLTSVMKTKRKRIDELENFHTTCWEILSEKKNKDEFSIFGEFVASEMRQMSDRSDLVFRLKHKIQKVILEISEEYALSVFGNQSNYEASSR
ncbi:hypothetical protein R5R35_001294 [Gryllus longicercus]|uniref:MADF domain-containing protein n=1 Tax=Gryllus longicercus TaxID=2509291 RepID=A0AAN9VMC8_9ORTH